MKIHRLRGEVIIVANSKKVTKLPVSSNWMGVFGNFES